jgi:uridine kinase
MVLTFEELAREIRARPARLGSVRLVAVDGPGGAGKSVFARRLSRALGGAPILETDDFASWDTRHKWWPRLEAEALEPLAAGRTARYERSRWAPTQPVEWRDVAPAEVVILEGVSSGREAVRDRLSYLVWIETPAARRLARGIERDGEAQRSDWELWMREEDEFFGRDDVPSRADLIVDGNPAAAHDPECEVVLA